VVAIDDSNGGDGIVALKDIKSIADLKGRKVAVNEGSVSEFYLNVLLGKAGLKESDLKTVNMTAADAGSAFVAKRVDAAVTWEPWLTRGKTTDFGHLLANSATHTRPDHRRAHRQDRLGKRAQEGCRGRRQVVGRGGRVLSRSPR